MAFKFAVNIGAHEKYYVGKQPFSLEWGRKKRKTDNLSLLVI